MYRRSKKYQQLRARVSAFLAAKERKRLEQVEEVEADLILPDLRKKIEIIDFESGEPNVTVLELYQSDRIDCYRVVVNGVLWKKRIGMSKILEGIRKAMPRALAGYR